MGQFLDGSANSRAQREREAVAKVLGDGADQISLRPWRPAPIPLSAVDLVEYTAANKQADDDTLLAALTLLPAARAELDATEASMLFEARSRGLTWSQIADAMGFRSPQACQQHFTRLTNRRDGA